MLFIKATNKYQDFKTIKEYSRLIIFLGILFILTLLSWFLYHNLIVTFTLSIASLIYFYLLASPIKNIEVVIYDDKVRFDMVDINYKNLAFWGVAELPNKLEIILQKNSLTPSYIYFYLDKKSEDLEKLVAVLSQNIPYNESITHQNQLHVILRYFGLK